MYDSVLDEDPRKTQFELADALKRIQNACLLLPSYALFKFYVQLACFKSKKIGYNMNVERRKTVCKLLLQWKKAKKFLYRILTGEQIHYDIKGMDASSATGL